MFGHIKNFNYIICKIPNNIIDFRLVDIFIKCCFLSSDRKSIYIKDTTNEMSIIVNYCDNNIDDTVKRIYKLQRE